jgi:hypothetical protein
LYNFFRWLRSELVVPIRIGMLLFDLATTVTQSVVVVGDEVNFPIEKQESGVHERTYFS